MRRKNGSTGNDPGEVICATVAPPSRTVLMTARKPISQASLRRSAGSCMKRLRAFENRDAGTGIRNPGPRPHTSRLCELTDQVEDRQIHRDHDAADDDAEH